VSSGFWVLFVGLLARQFDLAKRAFKGAATNIFAVSRFFLFLEKDVYLLRREHGWHLALGVNEIDDSLKAKLVSKQVDCGGGSCPTENQRILVRSVATPLDKLAGFLSCINGLFSTLRLFTVGVGVDRHDLFAQVVFDKI